MAIAAYLRVSTERQDLDNQGFAVGEHCKAHGFTLDDVVTCGRVIKIHTGTPGKPFGQYEHSCKNRHLGPVGAKM